MTAPLDLAGIGRWVSRPGATPAPTTPQPTPTNPFPTPFPSGPRHSDDPGLTRWAPNADRQILTELLDQIEALLNGPEVA